MLCSNCGHKQDEMNEFCDGCGHRMGHENSGSIQVDSELDLKKDNRKIKSIILLVSVLILVFGGFLGQGIFDILSGNSPEKVAMVFFNSVSKQDVTTFLSIIDTDTNSYMKGYIENNYQGKDFREKVNQFLAEGNLYFNDQYGSGWIKDIKLETIAKSNAEASFQIIIGNDRDVINLIKEGRKWKIIL